MQKEIFMKRLSLLMIAAFVAITQQFAIWQTLSGWVATGVFTILFLAYGYFMFSRPEKPGEAGD
jgi:uncharacterized membrane protein YbaN (DUF454 family)